MLNGGLAAPAWPAGFTLRTLDEADAPAVHALLVEAFDDEERSFDVWWAKRSGDAEFDPALCFLAFGPDGRLAGAALCWTSAFVKDLAVASWARRIGLGAALLCHVFAAFKERGAPHIDLKTSLTENADAVRLYRRAGMVEVSWVG